MDGLGEALGRLESRRGEPSQRESADENKPERSKKSAAHHYAVHVHKDGSHHLTAHHGGQLVHHSEHPHMEAAAEAMKEHAAGGEPDADDMGGGAAQV